MPNTLIPIQTYTLTSTASSVTFSNIPQNYTDLKIVYSGRDTTDSPGSVYIQFNGAGYNSTTTKINGTGSSVSSSSHNNAYLGLVPGPSQTANTFSNGEIYIPNYTSSTNKYFSSDVVNENDAQAAAQFLWTGLWANTAAITSVTLKTDQAFAVNSKFTLYGISNGVKATGGTLTVAGGYAYHTFTSTGSFLPSQQIKGAEIISIAGGGGGGSSNTNSHAGGGAGGVLFSNSVTLNAGNTYTALVGAGGAASISDNGGDLPGSNSVFSTIVSIGGGKTAGNGGSGGGARTNATPGSGTVGQGNDGGRGNDVSTPASSRASGGGGGAGEVGGNADNAGTGGKGGNGTSTYSSWATITGTGIGGWYGGGGGGGGNTSAGSGGAGGGGRGGGGTQNGTAGTANTGGGGGGGANPNGVNSGGAGGSGLIIVRYPLS